MCEVLVPLVRKPQGLTFQASPSGGAFFSHAKKNRTPERVASKDELSPHGLGRPRELYDRSVDVHICNIRQKLQALAGEAIGIETGCSIGYRLA